MNVKRSRDEEGGPGPRESSSWGKAPGGAEETSGKRPEAGFFIRPEPKPKGRKAEQSQGTRAALLVVARRLLAERGYAAVSTEEIVRHAGVTRGALYHHFRDKRDLFRAVFEQVEQEVAEKVAVAALSETDPWLAQMAAVEAFLDTCLEPAVQQIVLVDAPSVLGLATWRELEALYGLGLVRAGLQLLIDAGTIDPQPVEPLAHLVFGALTEAGLLIARAEDVEAARAEVGASVQRLLEGLKVERNG
jgi:AcrR family transcriptional regulator